MRRRAAVEPVIGHLKDDRRRPYQCRARRRRLQNFSLLLRWFRRLLRALLLILARALLAPRFA
jgi:IS5 family transposase